MLYSIALYNSFINILYDQRRFTISVSSTHPTPGEDIHHTVISCVGINVSYPNPAGDGAYGFTSYPRRRSNVSEASCLRTQRHAPARTWTRAVGPRVQHTDHWTTHASQLYIQFSCFEIFLSLLKQRWKKSVFSETKHVHPYYKFLCLLLIKIWFFSQEKEAKCNW